VGLFRKKPVLVEAIRFDGLESIDDIPTPMFEGSFDLVPRVAGRGARQGRR
jgi:hypothetical protein